MTNLSAPLPMAIFQLISAAISFAIMFIWLFLKWTSPRSLIENVAMWTGIVLVTAFTSISLSSSFWIHDPHYRNRLLVKLMIATLAMSALPWGGSVFDEWLFERAYKKELAALYLKYDEELKVRITENRAFSTSESLSFVNDLVRRSGSALSPSEFKRSLELLETALASGMLDPNLKEKDQELYSYGYSICSYYKAQLSAVSKGDVKNNKIDAKHYHAVKAILETLHKYCK